VTTSAISSRAPIAILAILAKNASGVTLSIDAKKMPPAARRAMMLTTNYTKPEPDMIIAPNMPMFMQQ
jgi:hypothetical protein